MNLKEFTKQTLLQIIEGADEANREYKKSGKALIDSTFVQHGNSFRNTITVDFDVATTASEESTEGGECGVTVMSVLKLGIGSDNKQFDQTVSRIRYSIPVTLAMDF